MKDEIIQIIRENDFGEDNDYTNRADAADDILELIKIEIAKGEIDFTWENGECSECGYDCAYDGNAAHKCHVHNMLLIRIMDSLK